MTILHCLQTTAECNVVTMSVPEACRQEVFSFLSNDAASGHSTFALPLLQDGEHSTSLIVVRSMCRCIPRLEGPEG